MSQENVEIVRESFTAYLAAVRDGDFGPLLVYFDPEVLVNQPPELPDARSYRGHDGVVEAFGDWPSQWDELRVHLAHEAGPSLARGSVHRNSTETAALDEKRRFARVARHVHPRVWVTKWL